MICPRCSTRFLLGRPWQRFCSERCRRNAAKSARIRVKHAAIAPCPCARCGKPFQPKRIGMKFCTKACATLAYQRQGRTAEIERMPGTTSHKTRLRCHWCRGPHPSDRCENRARQAPIIRQFGTVVDGEYVPYPGNKVRVIAIAHTVNGDTLTAFMKGAKR